MTNTPGDDSLQELVNRAVFMSTDAQMRFEQRIAERADDWDADFSEQPALRFGSEDPVVLRPHLIGSADSAYGTWRWGWSEENDWPLPVVELAHEVRARGAREGVAEFGTEEFDAKDEDALRLTLAAKAVTGRWTHFPLPVGTTTVWLLVDGDGMEAGEPEIRAIVKAIAAGLTLTDVSDHEAALRSYARLRGFPLADLPGGGLRILASDGSADVTFDDKHRLTNCQVHQPLEGEAAVQFARASGATVPAPAHPSETSAHEPQESTVDHPASTNPPRPDDVSSEDRRSEPEVVVEPAVTPTVEPATQVDERDERTVERAADVVSDSTTADAGARAESAKPAAAAQDADTGLTEIPTSDGSVEVTRTEAGEAAAPADADDEPLVFSDDGIVDDDAPAPEAAPATAATPEPAAAPVPEPSPEPRAQPTEPATHEDDRDAAAVDRDADVVADSTTADAGARAEGDAPSAAKQDTAADEKKGFFRRLFGR
ncbi:hypothetical protein GSY69_02135 [Brevibacterium sp. 5221]|uniref:Uncharacterized protein n=1 Tax=Brevibacterium rongguiense TaxID=2695267 RepID=A0A6N9H4H0_9MICO|nr:DUF6882 domain-containing protein [Brevibacterium rongguiense]MYM18809.1 hypothetical protein [Brevibacterium rongguiense]